MYWPDLQAYRALHTCPRCLTQYVAHSPRTVFCGRLCAEELNRLPEMMPPNRADGLDDAAFVDDAAYMIFVGLKPWEDLD